MSNYQFDLAQPCSARFTHKLDRDGKPMLDEDGNRILDAIVKPNTHRPFVLLEELLNEANFQECVEFYKLPEPISHFTSIFKATEDVESWSRYEYYLIARDIGLEQVCNLVNDGVVWSEFRDLKTKKPLYLPAFGDNQPVDHERLITYNDTHILVGRAWSARLIKRRDNK